MEKAVEVMRHSIREPRADSKASPLVGAVLVKPDGTVDTACRGELRQGDHAEYTLLERKHRDHDLTGASCHLVVTAGTVVVRSPGAPLPPVTVEQMQAFTAPMYNRNPKLQFAFGGTKLVEGRGLGMRTPAEAAAKHRLPVPRYVFDGLYLNLTICRHAQAALGALGAAILDKLSKSERSGWEWLSLRNHVTSAGYAEAMGLPYRTAMNHLRRFQKVGLLDKAGAARATEYRARKL